MSFGDVWNGTELLAISHAGGKFTDLAREVLGDFLKIKNRVQCMDNHTHHDRVLHKNQAFTEQMPVMTDAYLAWSLAKSKEEFKSFFERLQNKDLESNSAWDCGEWSISVIDVFYAEKVTAEILPTDTTISSVLVHQGVMPCSPISPTVGITMEALKLYCVAHLRCPHLSIQAFVKTVCDLHGDKEELTFRLLYAMDGNNLLKRVLQRSLDHADDSLAPSSEVPTGQQFTSDCYLPPPTTSEADEEDAAAENSCAGQWKNMDDAKTKKAWGIYNETGIFVAVCCHVFSLLVADMVQSGELAKYPLAVISKLLEVYGKQLGGVYDIGCQFKTMLNNSSLGPLAHSLQHTCLVGAFHGHAHRCLCQLFSLTTYIKGLGLKDLETCERTFSKSNSLVSALWYASVFHRQQAINSYFKHNDDFKVYAHLSNFSYGNYKQALDILNNGDATLPRLMQDLGFMDESIFDHWLEEEKVYLQGLMQEPKHKTLQMEYWQKSVTLTASENLRLVQALECKLEITTQWTPTDADWQRMGRLIAHRKYQHVLDCLEGLIIACIFELTKMNRAGNASSPPNAEVGRVVEYVFLADFDLLCDTRVDVSQQPWSLAAACGAMDLYFKMCQAWEEIQRLNVEVRCLVTYIQDKGKYLQTCKNQLMATRRFNAHHLKQLHEISKLPGFSGTIVPGVSINTGLGESCSTPNAQVPLPSTVDPDTPADLDDEEQAEEVEEEASRSLQDVLPIANDFS
ncbi:hypothetical protein BD769DRAFT_1630812 [Suillus cothurnatus]|nr:hypothetical protein BD769DRAFT_1630812 [Suillus cothurnatus]